MRLKIHQIAVELDYTEKDVIRFITRLVRCRNTDLDHLKILRRSLDARQKDRPPRYVISAEVNYTGLENPSLLTPGIERADEPETEPGAPLPASMAQVPVVVGAGPAGLLAALIMAEAGWNPLLVERGAEAEMRTRQVEDFWRLGLLNTESNVLYGEGGAGLFSDGKLTARSKDRSAIRRFFKTLVDCGAPSDILIDAEPHLGSDVLAGLIPALRNRIRERGGTVLFNSRLEDIHLEDHAVRGITVSGREIRTDTCLLAVGHSARDVYELLARKGVPLEIKPTAVGVRLELPQHRIDAAQYGRWVGHPRLGHASFRLIRNSKEGERNCYSFCMCPGGLVMACASDEGLLTTNGMSLSKRDKPFGNAAFLVPVGAVDFPSVGRHPALAGVDFQRALEKAAFQSGGGNYGLPAERLVDFLAGSDPKDIPEARSCIRARAADLHGILPEAVAHTLRSAIPGMLRELKGVLTEEALLYAAETRSSSPVRIVRDPDTLQSTGVQGLYPIGEGSGYSGGIVSSALDGMKAADRLIHKIR